jgi:hypothetical protein
MLKKSLCGCESMLIFPLNSRVIKEQRTAMNSAMQSGTSIAHSGKFARHPKPNRAAYKQFRDTKNLI